MCTIAVTQFYGHEIKVNLPNNNYMGQKPYIQACSLLFYLLLGKPPVAQKL